MGGRCDGRSEFKSRYSQQLLTLLPRTWSGLAWSGPPASNQPLPITHSPPTDRFTTLRTNPIDTRHTQPIDLLYYPIINPSGKASKTYYHHHRRRHYHPRHFPCLFLFLLACFASTLARLLRRKVQSLAHPKAKELDSDRTLISFLFLFPFFTTCCSPPLLCLVLSTLLLAQPHYPDPTRPAHQTLSAMQRVQRLFFFFTF